LASMAICSVRGEREPWRLEISGLLPLHANYVGPMRAF
jgi:hypothetical protein